MGPLGVPEMIFIFVLALLILGPKKLPELGKSIGKGMAEFRRASNELRSTFEREMDNLEHEKKTLNEVSQSFKDVTATPYATPPPEDNVYEEFSDSSDYNSTYSDSAPLAAENQPAPNSGESPVSGSEQKVEAKS